MSNSPFTFRSKPSSHTTIDKKGVTNSGDASIDPVAKKRMKTIAQHQLPSEIPQNPIIGLRKVNFEGHHSVPTPGSMNGMHDLLSENDIIVNGSVGKEGKLFFSNQSLKREVKARR